MKLRKHQLKTWFYEWLTVHLVFTTISQSFFTYLLVSAKIPFWKYIFIKYTSTKHAKIRRITLTYTNSIFPKVASYQIRNCFQPALFCNAHLTRGLSKWQNNLGHDDWKKYPQYAISWQENTAKISNPNLNLLCKISRICKV